MQQPMKHPHDPPPPPPPPMAAKRPVSAFGKANPLQHPRGALGMKRPMGKALPRPMLPTLAREPVAVENGDKSDDGNGTPLSHASDGATMRSSPPREVVEAGEGDVSVSAELTVDQPQPLEASSSSPVLPATEVAQADDDVPDSVTDVPTTAAPIMTELLTSPRASSPSPGQPPADQVPQRAGSSQMQPASELRRLVASPAGLESQRGGSTGSSAPSLAPPPLPGPQRGGAPASRESSVVVNPSKMAPKEQTEKEATVVAQGASPQVLQLPSPVYCAEWMDDTHVLICAGGGGKRFGMANIVVLLTVLAGSENSVSGVVRLNAKLQSSVQRAKAPGAAPEQNSLWRCEAAVDLGGDIPWCATKYLPVEDALSQRPSSAPSDLVGFIGISSITSMLLVSVHRSQGSSSSCFTLQRCARVTVPHDLTNPDKKPIALVRNALVVAHDHKAVCIYSLADLVPWSRSPATAMVEEAAPLAEWPVPARVNDLDANRFHLVFTKNPKEERTGRSGSVAHQGTSKDTTGRSQSAAGGPAEGASASTDAKLSCTALVHEYVLISAAIQDKTLRLATFRWRRCFEEANVAGGQAAVERTPLPISENLALSGKDCRLPFTLMGSSLRLVRLFGFEQVPPSGRDEALRRMTLESLRQHRQGQSSDSTAVASLVFVAYDSRGNASYLGNVQISASSGPHKASTEGNDEGRHRKRLTGLQVRMNAAPTAIVEDGVTSLSPIFPLPQEARQHPHGLVVPQRWLVGTVEGWIAEVGPKVDSGGEGHTATPARTAKSSDLDLMLVHRRPSVERRVARQFPSLHKEPISAVAVSANNVVISTDIAQNVVITTLPPPSGKTKEPLVFPLFPEPSSLLAVMLASTTVQRGLILLVSLFILLVALLLA